MSILRTIRTKVLEIAFLDEGAAAGWPIILAHGFPYDVHAYDDVVPRLAQAGARVIVPYLRGFGPTRFLSKSTMRSGQQAALGQDLIDLFDALGIQRAMLAGYDWGGLASCSTWSDLGTPTHRLWSRCFGISICFKWSVDASA
jgi:pimeloyl-ACP methyl ester carboxylesterase